MRVPQMDSPAPMGTELVPVRRGPQLVCVSGPMGRGTSVCALQRCASVPWPCSLLALGRGEPELPLPPQRPTPGSLWVHKWVLAATLPPMHPNPGVCRLRLAVLWSAFSSITVCSGDFRARYYLPCWRQWEHIIHCPSLQPEMSARAQGTQPPSILFKIPPKAWWGNGSASPACHSDHLGS